MKHFAIYDRELDRSTPIGYLFYYEKQQLFLIELCADLGEWEAPLLFQSLVAKGIFTISKELSKMWVEERVIPSGRQNLGLILKNHKLKEYSEMAFLRLSDRKCAQDHCFIREVLETEIPQDILARTDGNVTGCFFGRR